MTNKKDRTACTLNPSHSDRSWVSIIQMPQTASEAEVMTMNFHVTKVFCVFFFKSCGGWELHSTEEKHFSRSRSTEVPLQTRGWEGPRCQRSWIRGSRAPSSAQASMGTSTPCWAWGLNHCSFMSCDFQEVTLFFYIENENNTSAYLSGLEQVSSESVHIRP